MATVIVEVLGCCDLCLDSGDAVSLCLDPTWISRTVSGLALATGTLVAVAEVATNVVPNSCCPGSLAAYTNTECRYQVTVDDVQFLDDISTGAPYLLTDTDVVAINPYECFVQRVVDRITQIEGAQSINDVTYFADQSYDAVSIGNVINGNSAIATSAFVSKVINNPSSVLPIDVEIQVFASIETLITAGVGDVRWGHGLWINGALVPSRNGRLGDAFSNWLTNSDGFWKSSVLPTIIYKHTIPADGSVTIGLDFGDTEMANTGTPEGVQLLSRQLSVQGIT